MKTLLSLKARAMQLLAQREHSRVELRRKLLAYASQQEDAIAPTDAMAGPSDDAPLFSRRLPPSTAAQGDVDDLLDWLVANQHLSETRFVESRLRTRAARQGNLRIRQELAQHGLQLGPDAQQALKDSEFGRAQQVWARKFEALPSDAAARAKQTRFLVGRGFSSEVIRRVLRGDDD